MKLVILALGLTSLVASSATVTINNFNGNIDALTSSGAALQPGFVGLFNFATAPSTPSEFVSNSATSQLGLTTLSASDSFDNGRGTQLSSLIEFDDGEITDGQTVFVALGEGSDVGSSSTFTLFEFVAQSLPTPPGAQEDFGTLVLDTSSLVSSSFGTVSGSVLELAPVPEPSASLLAIASLGLVLRRRR